MTRRFIIGAEGLTADQAKKLLQEARNKLLGLDTSLEDSPTLGNNENPFR